MTNLHDNHVIKVFGDIDTDTAKDFISEIVEHSINPTQEITVLLNSDGGCLYSMFAMHDVMRHVDNPILVIGLGQVMSAAAVLLTAGDRREVMPNTTIMLHEPILSDLSDEYKVGDLEIEMAHLQDLRQRMYKLLSQYTGQTVKSLTRDLGNRDFYLTAKEAKDYGLIDSIRQLKVLSRTAK